jgi:cytochrome b561
VERVVRCCDGTGSDGWKTIPRMQLIQTAPTSVLSPASFASSVDWHSSCGRTVFSDQTWRVQTNLHCGSQPTTAASSKLTEERFDGRHGFALTCLLVVVVVVVTISVCCSLFVVCSPRLFEYKTELLDIEYCVSTVLC